MREPESHSDDRADGAPALVDAMLSTVSIPAVLVTPLPAPSSVGPHKLSRSEQLFASCTGIDPRALKIGQGEEFFIFMDLRAEERWASFNMTSRRWVAATRAYNERLKVHVDTHNDKLHPSNVHNRLVFIEKHPRALADKISSVETDITNRITTNNYYCKSLVSVICTVQFSLV